MQDTIPILDVGPTTEEVVHLKSPPISGAQKVMRSIGWGTFFIAMFVLFTLLKLPDAKIRANIQAHISNALAPYGLTFTTQEGHLRLGWGLYYEMKGITLRPAPPALPIQIDRVALQPSFLKLFTGALGGQIQLNAGDGLLTLDAGMRGSSTGSVQINAQKLNLGRLGILHLLGGLEGSGLLSGEAGFEGDFSTLSKLNGRINLDLSKFKIEAQSVQGFAIPAISDSVGKIDLEIIQGKASVKAFTIGKPGNPSDDLILKGFGDITLTPQLASSSLNLKGELKLSDRVMDSFKILDALLGQAKQADGSFAFTLVGPFSSPNLSPATGKNP